VVKYSAGRLLICPVPPYLIVPPDAVKLLPDPEVSFHAVTLLPDTITLDGDREFNHRFAPEIDVGAKDAGIGDAVIGEDAILDPAPLIAFKYKV
jgi:hypothetical protein